ncbi:unnamed protein product [Dracunculus medinensis]|uniref:V-type proton ATPase subunit a n=1 Tax=Dracunculus medinensis TaxID=318479 RepID=A0A0N4U411_DRAME|nr:unnamed protein product [Dracunculus medinensis]
MGSLYRSEQMRFCQMIVQKDAAFACVAELGKRPYVQFKDLNAAVNPFQRIFVRDVRRFDELERKLRAIENDINDAGIDIVKAVPDKTYEVMPPHELNHLESTLVDLERDVNNMNESDILLKRNNLELKEWEAILEKTDQFFQGGISDVAMQEIDAVEGEEVNIIMKTQEPIGFCTGVINRDRVNAFERVLWRACRRTAFVRTVEIEEELVDPDTATKLDRHEALREVRARIQDLTTVMAQTQEHRYRVLKAASYNYYEWQKQVRMQKAVYQTLNLFTFDSIGKFFVAECWVPLADLENVREALERAVEAQGSSVKPVLNLLETAEEPPTYNRVNKFTAVFQSIVDSYGIASYLEVNPEKNLMNRNIDDEIFSMFFGGRYIILLMGLFSIHAGILYNDAFSKSFNIFGSSWRIPFPMTEIDSWIGKTKEMDVELPPDPSFEHNRGPYPFGIDPIWNLGENKLNFLNSLKMKLSVIIGISQMTFGVILSLMNYRFFKSNIEIFTVFIPQLIFISFIFIYLCIQIILKWIFFWVREEYVFGNLYPGSHCAPSLLIGLINMVMFKDREIGFVNMTNIIEEKDNKTIYAEYVNCYLGQWYPGQSIIEAFLVVIAVLCIPVMLFGKPLYFLLKRRKSKQAVADKLARNMLSFTIKFIITTEESFQEFGDLMVHQAIHTIEYVLGCISHTASYLRLWALSLAHAQLSEVLWEMVLRIAFKLSGVGGYIVLYLIFFIFGVLSISILVLMEGLSAFLHALRLHWVEFQSKFYLGLGYQFVPFYFRDVLERIKTSDK